VHFTWKTNREANGKLKVTWEGESLVHCNTPLYLWVILDKTLMYKYLCERTSKKINTRNGLLRKLIGSKWDAQPHALRVSAIKLCLSVGEYAWGNSAHVKKIFTALNNACRIVTGCLKNTLTEKVYLLASIAPPSIRRLIAFNLERHK